MYRAEQTIFIIQTQTPVKMLNQPKFFEWKGTTLIRIEALYHLSIETDEVPERAVLSKENVGPPTKFKKIHYLLLKRHFSNDQTIEGTEEELRDLYEALKKEMQKSTSIPEMPTLGFDFNGQPVRYDESYDTNIHMSKDLHSTEYGYFIGIDPGNWDCMLVLNKEYKIIRVPIENIQFLTVEERKEFNLQKA